jgi:hypothetical protein
VAIADEPNIAIERDNSPEGGVMLRRELRVPVLDQQRLDTLKSLISKTVYGMDDPAFDPSPYLDEIYRLSGRSDFDADMFFHAYDMADDGDFAAELALGTPPVVSDMTRDEITTILSSLSPDNDRYYHNLLERAFPDVFDTDLIYWPLKEMTYEEIADELLHRQKIFEAGGRAAFVSYLRSSAEAVLADPAAPVWAQMGATSILELYLETQPPV